VRIAELTDGKRRFCSFAKKWQNKANLFCWVTKDVQAKGARQPRLSLLGHIAVEHDVSSYAMGDKNVLRKLNLLETLNPCAREFRAPIIKTAK
jgi:hypothetical protein